MIVLLAVLGYFLVFALGFAIVALILGFGIWLILALVALVYYLIESRKLWTRPGVLRALREGRERNRPISLLAQDVSHAVDLLPLQITLYVAAALSVLLAWASGGLVTSLPGAQILFLIFVALLSFKSVGFFVSRYRTAIQAMANRHLQIAG